jgi:hypothetical protein
LQNFVKVRKLIAKPNKLYLTAKNYCAKNCVFVVGLKRTKKMRLRERERERERERKRKRERGRGGERERERERKKKGERES